MLWRSLIKAPFDMLDGFDRWREPTLDADAEVVARGLGLFYVRQRTDDLAQVVPANNAGLFAAIQRQVRDGDIVVDAGANIGAVTVFLGNRLGAAGRIFSIEMIPETAACLRKNIELNQLQNVMLIQKALSDLPDNLLVASLEPGLYGEASIATDPANRAVRKGDTLREVKVISTTLDEVLAGIEAIALLKLDLEGGESQALRGATESLKRIHSVVFESWTEGGGEAAVLLSKSGFQVAAIGGQNFLALRPPRE